jgi:hypothetical protein
LESIWNGEAEYKGIATLVSLYRHYRRNGGSVVHSE